MLRQRFQSEQAMWRSMTAYVKKFPALVKFERVDNKLGATGIPDVHFQFCKGRLGWIELKLMKEKRGLDHFTKKQKSWLRNYHSWGGLAFVLIQDLNGELFLIKGISAPLVTCLNLDELAVWHGYGWAEFLIELPHA